MLVSMKELLLDAERKNYALGAFNCTSLENACAVVNVAERLEQPVILQYAEAHKSIVPIEAMGPALVNLAKEASVPIAVHFDHGSTYEMFVKAIQLGFTSVMIDASSYPLDENIRKTKEIVRLAHAVGVTVEAELGHVFTSSVGGAEGSESDSAEEYSDLDAIYTDPEEALYFVEETGIDCLAIAFGTVHGVYFTKPKLDLDRVSRIRDKVGIPLVMHGGSGISEEDFGVAIENGIRKINYYTYMNRAGGEAVHAYIKNLPEEKILLYDDLSVIAQKGMENNIEEAMKIFRHRKN